MYIYPEAAISSEWWGRGRSQIVVPPKKKCWGTCPPVPPIIAAPVYTVPVSEGSGSVYTAPRQAAGYTVERRHSAVVY